MVPGFVSIYSTTSMEVKKLSSISKSEVDHNEELHNLYSSPSIIRMVKSRRIRWAGHIARLGRRYDCI
jgi:hypothetical protein